MRMIQICALSMLAMYLNGHVGRHTDGLDAVHGEHGLAQRKLQGKMLLESWLEKEPSA